MEKNYLDLKNLLDNGQIKTNYELSGGMMNKSFVFSFENKEYVYYVPSEQANEMVDRKLEEKAHKTIYSLGITSKNIAFYDNGAKINEFIPGDSLNHVNEFDYKKIANMLHKLHDSKLNIGVDYDPFSKVLNYEKEALSLGIKLDEEYKQLLDVVLLKRDYLESFEKVLCHNDFQRSNIIKSTDGNYYMIDFEFAMNNDPYFDIAGFGNTVVEEGFELLKNYCNNLITRDDLERFFYWRILLSLQWYLVALIKDIRGEGKEHGYNFVEVANFFLNNAHHAYELLQEKLRGI